MPARTDQREALVTALKAFEDQPLEIAGRRLFATLGYESDRRLPIATGQDFFEQLDPHARLTTREHEALNQLTSLHLLFQLTDAELSVQRDLFEDTQAVNATKIESYLFFAAELLPGHYTRTDLSSVVRAVNKPLPMPALVLLRHGDTLSLGIIHRRLHKRDQARDVLDKVTLIKDIASSDPIRAHVEILNDFVLANLDADFGVSNFVRLHEAWQKRLGSYALSNDFYREIADWYFWAHHQVEEGVIRLPQHCDTEQEQSLFLIRLLTRVIFCWFLVEKRLIPTDLFREHRLKALLKEFHPSKDPVNPDAASTYYHAILQNLFFGTLNTPPDQRAFRGRKKAGARYDSNYGITNLWRYEQDFRDPGDWLAVSARVPFLNGGLFDCLDDKTNPRADNSILDGFSDNPNLGCHLPNDLFFGPARTADLSRDYGEEGKRTARSKKARVRGLIEILSRYKFTIEENTPLEEEIALDPELLGKVFENLLASYNEDTRTTARKALGAFYTPREIVSYMVDEALKSYLGSQVPRCKGALEDLFSNKATLRDIKPDTREALIAAVGRVKILDPACGSGAFPMGALHRLVDLLQKLDPNNESWKRDRLAEAHRYRQLLEEAGAPAEELAACDARIADIEKSFDTRFHALDFARKLYLVENCIYGVDIQPIATQIAKLRFLISLVVDQKVDTHAANLGVRPLPNLETRLVAADTLIPLPKPKRRQVGLFEDTEALREHDRLKRELERVRHEHFNARDPRSKRHWREEDHRVREALGDLLAKTGMPAKAARDMAAWDPYDQNSFARFFDPEWMFGIPVGKVQIQGKAAVTLLGNLALINEGGGQTELVASVPREIDSGFDIVIGNPPYVRQEQLKHLKPQFKEHFECFAGTADLYIYFYEAGIKLLRSGGTFSFITSNKWFRTAYGEKLRLWLPRNTRILQLIDFGDAPVFTAIAYPCIVIVQRIATPRETDDNIRVLTWEQGPSIETFADVFANKSFTLRQTDLKPDGWRLESRAELRFMEQLKQAGPPLREYVGARVSRGITTGLNEAFVVDNDTRHLLIKRDRSSEELIRPYSRGKDVNRWWIGDSGLHLIKIESSENKGHLWSTKKGKDAEQTFAAAYPAIHSHLENFRAALIDRDDQGRFFWELRSCRYWHDFEQPKLVSTNISIRPTFALDTDGRYLGNTSYFVPAGECGHYLLGLLNSQLFEAYARRTFVEKQGGWYEIQPNGLESFPVPTAAESQRRCVEELARFLIVYARHGRGFMG